MKHLVSFAFGSFWIGVASLSIPALWWWFSSSMWCYGEVGPKNQAPIFSFSISLTYMFSAVVALCQGSDSDSEVKFHIPDLVMHIPICASAPCLAKGFHILCGSFGEAPIGAAAAAAIATAAGVSIYLSCTIHKMRKDLPGEIYGGYGKNEISGSGVSVILATFREWRKKEGKS